jgi:L-threonylcarbamoyladenylate synthase
VTEQERIDLAALTPAESLRVTAAVAAAHLVCFPTDTVYGVGGVLDPVVGDAIQAAKGRAAGKPLQVIFPTREVLLAGIPAAGRLRDAFYRLLPGPVTLVIPYPQGFAYPPPGEVTHVTSSVLGLRRRERVAQTLGVRVPRWPVGARLLATLPYPLIASSANPSGVAGEARSLDRVDAGVLAACDLLLDGGPTGGRASTVLDLSRYEEGGGWQIMREGEWGESEITELLTRRREDLPTP